MNPISVVIIVVALSLMLRYVAKGSKQDPLINEDGKKVLRLPLLYEVIGCLLLICFLMIGIFLFSAKGTSDTSDIADLAFGIGVFGFFCFLSILLILSRRKSIVIFDEEKIEAHYIFVKPRSMLCPT
jgi:hypothetical protein